MKGWYGNRMSHSLASKGIKTVTKPKIDMRKRYLVGSVDEWDWINSMNTLEYIRYLEHEDDSEMKRITYEEYLNQTKDIGKIVERRERIVDHDSEEGHSGAMFSLTRLYIDLGMLDKAKESIKELSRRGYNVSIYKQKYGIDIDD